LYVGKEIKDGTMIERGRSLKIENNVEESGFSGDQESSKELK